MEGKERSLDYDEVLSHIGQFGAVQRRIFLLLSLVAAAAGIAVVVFAFTGLVPNYRCRVPKWEGSNATYFQDELSETPSLPPWYNGSIGLADRCKIPQVREYQDEGPVPGIAVFPEVGGPECPSSSLVFDRTMVTSSLVEEYNFLCDGEWKRTVYSSLYMLGMLAGSYFFGWVSDTFGRMKSLMLAVTTVSLTGLLGAFCMGSGSVHVYGFLRFLTGMGGTGCFIVAFVLMVEHVGHKFTTVVAIAFMIPFAIGEGILGVEAYFIRDWKTLQVVAHLPVVVLLVIWWLVPESPRWLLGSGNLEQAREVMESIARGNNKDVPEHLLKTASIQKPVDEGARSSVLDLFRSRCMALRTLNMGFQWFSVTMSFYGLSFASTTLSSDGPYVNFMLSVFIEIPGYLFSLLVVDSWGRRPILSICQVISGVACVACSLLQGHTNTHVRNTQVFLSLLGKFGASAAYSVVYLYTAELFPTPIRSQAVGTCSLVARLGGISALLLDNLKVLWLPAPVFLMGCVATVAGALATMLPETLGCRLPDSLEQAVSIGVDSKRSVCNWGHADEREKLQSVQSTSK